MVGKENLIVGSGENCDKVVGGKREVLESVEGKTAKRLQHWAKASKMT